MCASAFVICLIKNYFTFLFLCDEHNRKTYADRQEVVSRPLAASAASAAPAALDALDASAAAVAAAAAVKSLQLVVVLLASPIQQYTGHAQLHGTKRTTSVSFLEILVINTLSVLF